MVKIHPLTFADLEIFQRKDVLYIADFRGLSENFEIQIPAYFKYENLFQLICPPSFVVNTDSTLDNSLTDSPHKVFKVPKSPDARTTVIERFCKQCEASSIKKIWQTIPHPKLDEVCKQHGIANNYSYASFLERNNKVVQKKLHPNTPKWQVVTYASFPDNFSLKYYIKRSHGSGGYALYTHEELLSCKEAMQHEKEFEWYIEERVEGTSQSIQIYSSNGNHTVFGWTEQLIQQDKHFTGARLHSVHELYPEHIHFVEQTIEALIQLLAGYDGLWGIDLIFNPETKKISFLEANIRTTAVTFPMLIVNQQRQNGVMIYMEDLSKNAVETSDLIIASDGTDFDILRR